MTREEVLLLPVKACTRCGQTKERSEFFMSVRKGNACSHSECKECTKRLKREWAKKEAAWTREYSRNYYAEHTEERKEQHRLWSKSKAPGFHRCYVTRQKANARKAVAYEVRMGRLVREACQECGNLKTEAHHKAYSKPLDIIWLCKTHHGLLSRKDAI